LEAPPGFSGGAIISGGPDHGSRDVRDRLGHIGLAESRKRKDDRALDKDEEDYFNEDRYLSVCSMFSTFSIVPL
jgi:hypothetical protein